MPKTCPKCNSQINDAANFCPQCGQQLTGEPLNPAWVLVAVQERIKDARRSELFGLICCVIGGVLEAIIIIPHIVLHMKWETMDSVEAIGFLILCIWGGVSKGSAEEEKRKLINRLEKGK